MSLITNLDPKCDSETINKYYIHFYLIVIINIDIEMGCYCIHYETTHEPVLFLL